MGNESARQRDANDNMDSSGTQLHLEGIPAQVVRVHIDGVSRTKRDIIVSNVKEIFGVQHYKDLVLTALYVKSRLQGLGCFSNVDIEVDTSKEGGQHDYEVTFDVKEHSRIGGAIRTIVGNQEGSLTGELKMPNLFGRGERLQVESSRGTNMSTQINASFIRPIHSLMGGGKLVPPMLSSTIFQKMHYCVPSGFKETSRGVFVDFSFFSGPQVAHSLQWEGAWRDLTCLSRESSFAVRSDSGHTLKSSVKHVVTVDRRDSLIFPNNGSLFRLSSEFAGLGGNVGFFKNELELQANLPLISLPDSGGISDVVLQGSYNMGLVTPSNDERKVVSISDKLFLGGPLNVRGFEMRGLGPSTDGSATGGCFYWASGLHLYTTLPFLTSRTGFGSLIRTHLFMTSGNLLNSIEFNLDRGQLLDAMLHGFRLSCGLGLVLRLGDSARVELNYCLPIQVQKGDKISPGLQCGVGVNFL